MKTHLMIALLAMMAGACSSHRDVASVQSEKSYDETQHARMIDGPGSRIR